MSYFKPLNSNENNLHVIRFSYKSNATILYPSLNQLPSAFSTLAPYVSNGNLIINYAGIFDSSDIPAVFVQSNITTSTFAVLNKTTVDCNIYCADIVNLGFMPDVDICIIGKKASGPVFAISNRGWKFTTQSTTNDNIIYSDMLVGVGTDNPKFSLTHSGNLGFIPNSLKSSTLDTTTLQNNYLNLINVDQTSNLILPVPTSTNGQIMELSVVGVSSNQYLNLNMLSSNMLKTNTSNIILQSIGDSVSLCSYNSKWVVINQNINQLIPTYNQISTSAYSTPSVFLNGKLSIININGVNADINLPASTGYDGTYVEIVVGANTYPYYAELILSNITCNQSSLVLSNIGDHVKLFGYNSKWLLTNSNFY
jgi:hypothetical protein